LKDAGEANDARTDFIATSVIRLTSVFQFARLASHGVAADRGDSDLSGRRANVVDSSPTQTHLPASGQ